MIAQQDTDAIEFPPGDSITARLIRRHDWSDTPLGPIAGWPARLRAFTEMVLVAKLPMVVVWGDAGIMLYNDAYAAVLGPRHPALLGCPIRDGWPEARAFVGNIMDVVMAGGTLTYRDQELELYRDGTLRKLWADLDYSPLPDGSGKIGGVLAIITETTGRVLAERQLSIGHDRLRAMFEQSPGFIAVLEGPDHVFTVTNAAYRRLLGDRELIGLMVRDAVPEERGQGFVRLLDNAYRTGKPFVGDGLKLALAGEDGALEDHYLDFVYQPVFDDNGAVTGIFVQGSDVTQRVLGERSLRESEAEYHKLNDALLRANDLVNRSARLV